MGSVVDVYKRQIKPNAGYTDNGIAANVFKVSTADATTSTAGTGSGITVTASFNVCLLYTS